MKFHTNELTANNFYDAANLARVHVVGFRSAGSRSRSMSFDIHLEGESRRRPNGGSSGAGSGFAATWDQWGVFIAFLYDLDRDMTCWAYKDENNFHLKTNFRFEDGWPTDAHGDHTFRFADIPREQQCTKCTAVARWF